MNKNHPFIFLSLSILCLYDYIPYSSNNKALQWQIHDWDYIFLYSITSGSALGTNQLHIRWVAEGKGIFPWG
jgi:hypothetical protein